MNMTEYGIFSAEGKIEGDFYLRVEDDERLKAAYTDEDEAYVSECCPDHPDCEAFLCEECLECDEDA